MTKDTILAIAGEVGLDGKRLEADMANPEWQTVIDRNRALAKDLGISGTPGFIAGSELQPGALDLNGLKELVARARNGKWFYWNYGPPKGTDTARVFSSTDLETAQVIRQRVKGLQATATKTSGKIGTRSVTAAIESIREYLSQAAARGIVAVYDSTSHVPGPVDTGQPGSPTSSPTSVPAPSIPESISTPDALLANSTGPASDWAATSVTIHISE
jgi:DSBA-like thioredoxin domain